MLDETLNSSVNSSPANTLGPSQKEMDAMARRRFQNPKPFREGAWWYLRVWQDAIEDGKPVRKLKRIKLAASTVPDRRAKKLAAEYVRPMNQGLITVGAAVSFPDFVRTTYEPVILPNRAASVQRAYKGVIKNRLNPAFERLTLADLTPLTVQSFFTDLTKKAVPFPTIMKTRDAFASILKAAVKYKFITSNPIEGLVLPREKRKKRSKPFIYPAQFSALLKLVPEPYSTMVCVAVWSGLRISELIALKWRSIAGDAIVVEERFCRGEWSEPKTDASAGIVSVDSALIARIHRLKTLTVDVRAGNAIRKYKVVKANGPDDLVFQSVKDGKPMNDGNILRRFLKPAAEKLKLEHVNWRCLRTSCATWMVQSGADPKSVQGQMRHARISTTMEIYAQFVPEGQRRAVEQMAEYARKSILESGTNAGTLAVQ